MLSNINALEEFPRQIARGRRTEEISGRQSNHTRYPENHGVTSTLQFPAIISEKMRHGCVQRVIGEQSAAVHTLKRDIRLEYKAHLLRKLGHLEGAQRAYEEREDR